MLEKGIVLELKEHYAIVLKPGGELLRIQRKEGLQVGNQIYILPEDHYTEGPAVLPFPERAHAPRRGHSLRKLAGLAAAAILLLTLFLYPASQTVYAVASFDGGQDLQLELNRRSQIMNGYSCGEQLPDAELQSLKGRTLSEVSGELTARMGAGPVLIGYASHQDDPEKDAETEQLLREMFSDHIVLYLSGNGEDIALAESSKTSLGFHLAGEIVDEDIWECFDEFLETYEDLQEELEDRSDEDEDDEDDESDDLSYLEAMSLDELVDEIQRNPALGKIEEVPEILADKIEERHEAHKEEIWDSEDDEDDEDDPEDEDSDEGEDDEEDD